MSERHYRYRQYNSWNQRMDQLGSTISEKFKRELRAEDFVLVSQQNKEYKTLLKIMSERETLLSSQVSHLQKRVQRLQNEKEEYKLRNNQYAIQLGQHESIKQQLFRQYKLLKREIEEKLGDKLAQQKEAACVESRMEALLLKHLELQQDSQRKDLIIDQLRQHLKLLQKQLMEKKIRLFSHSIENGHASPATKLPSKASRRKQTRREASFLQSSKAQTSSRLAANTQLSSISFSLVSEQSDDNARSKRSNLHNKSIYL